MKLLRNFIWKPPIGYTERHNLPRWKNLRAMSPLTGATEACAYLFSASAVQQQSLSCISTATCEHPPCTRTASSEFVEAAVELLGLSLVGFNYFCIICVRVMQRGSSWDQASVLLSTGRQFLSQRVHAVSADKMKTGGKRGILLWLHRQTNSHWHFCISRCPVKT